MRRGVPIDEARVRDMAGRMILSFFAAIYPGEKKNDQAALLAGGKASTA